MMTASIDGRFSMPEIGMVVHMFSEIRFHSDDQCVVSNSKRVATPVKHLAIRS